MKHLTVFSLAVIAMTPSVSTAADFDSYFGVQLSNASYSFSCAGTCSDAIGDSTEPTIGPRLGSYYSGFRSAIGLDVGLDAGVAVAQGDVTNSTFDFAVRLRRPVGPVGVSIGAGLVRQSLNVELTGTLTYSDRVTAPVYVIGADYRFEGGVVFLNYSIAHYDTNMRGADFSTFPATIKTYDGNVDWRSIGAGIGFLF